MVLLSYHCGMRDRNKEILAIRMPEGLKEHIKAIAKPTTNAWIVAKLKKASGYK